MFMKILQWIEVRNREIRRLWRPLDVAPPANPGSLVIQEIAYSYITMCRSPILLKNEPVCFEPVPNGWKNLVLQNVEINCPSDSLVKEEWSNSTIGPHSSPDHHFLGVHLDINLHMRICLRPKHAIVAVDAAIEGKPGFV
jgi:hypothetical protein